MLSTEGMVYRSVTISEIKVYPECFCKIFLGFGNSITEGISLGEIGCDRAGKYRIGDYFRL